MKFEISSEMAKIKRILVHPAFKKLLPLIIDLKNPISETQSPSLNMI